MRSSGFGPVDLPAIDDAVAAMRRRGLDVSAHRSSTTTTSLVDGADLILTAERDHVVKIAALSSAAFRRALTLPEFLEATADGDVDGGADIRTWVESLTAERTAGEYLRAEVPEVDDPTGSSPRAFEAAVVAIEQQCDDVVAQLARAPGLASRLDWRNGGDSNPRNLSVRPLSRRVHSSALPPFRDRGYRRYTPGLPGEVPERPNGAPC